jgi:penicillin-binding protein 1A
VRTLLKLALTIIGAGLGLAAALLALSIPVRMMADAGSGEPTEISLDPLEQRSYVYAADGSTLAGLHGEINREPVSLEDVPTHLVDAIVAVEDQGFWVHDGVDGRGIVRALQTNVGEGGVAQGGSTLTQQVVKLALVGDEQSLERKVQEFVLARRLEREMSKEEILTRYINVAYFGNGAYGVEAAAETYFGVSASELEIGQSALLAGMIRNPRFADPVDNPENAKDRREQALGQMEELAYISADERDWHAALPLPEEVQESAAAKADDYFVDTVLQEMLKDEANHYGLGSDAEDREQAVYQGGLRVYTTYDPGAQDAAEAARDDVLPGEQGVFDAGEGRQGSGAMISVDPASGAVRTMVAGAGFQRGTEEDEATGEQFNLATRNERQIGSTTKAFTLTEIFEQGHSPLDQVDGTGPCRFANPEGSPNPYEANNYGDSPGQVDSLIGQTARSSNCGFVRLALIAGYENVSATAERLGVKQSTIETNLAAALGSSEATPLEMASAYATLANDGVYNQPYYIDRIEGADGRVIYEHEAQPERAVESETARLVTEVLANNVTNGTGTNAAVPGHATAGKTGTTDENSDVWFVGYTPHLATAVWVGGLDGNFPIRIEGAVPSSSEQPSRMFGQFMAAYHAGRDPIPFEAPTFRQGGELLRADPEVDLSGGAGPRPTDEDEEPDEDEDDDEPGRPGEGRGRPPSSRPDETSTTTSSSTTSSTPVPPSTLPLPTWPPPTEPEDPDPGGGGGPGGGGNG